MISPASCHKWT